MTTSVQSLASWLLERITEDERFWELAAEMKQAHADLVRRYLADCESRRQIIERLGPPYHLTGGSSAAYDEVLRLLAVPYADRPGYREEWKP